MRRRWWGGHTACSSRSRSTRSTGSPGLCAGRFRDLRSDCRCGMNSPPSARSRNIQLLIDEKAPVTLFLDQLSSLKLETIDVYGVAEPKVLTRNSRNRRTSLRGRGLTMEEVTVDRRRFLIASRPVDEAAFRASVDRAVEQRHPVEKWREWSGAPIASIALPMSADAKAGSFYAFLPMDNTAPFNGCLDAPFFPNTDRRDLDLSNPLNAFLLDAVADLCLAVAEEVAEGNENSFEMACASVDALAWYRDADSRRYFRLERRFAKNHRRSLAGPSMRCPDVTTRPG